MVLLRLVFFGLHASCLTLTLVWLLVPLVESISSLSSRFIKVCCILALLDFVVCEVAIMILNFLEIQILVLSLLEPISCRLMLRRRSCFRRRWGSHQALRNMILRLLINH